MTLAPDEADLIEAQRLRDMARANVRTNLQTLRDGLTERPLTTRVRDQVVSTAVDTAESGIDLALENKALLGLTLASVVGWLFRKRLGGLAQAGWTAGWNWAERRLRR